MPATFHPVPGFPGLLLVEPQRFADGRGWFLESYKASEYARHGLPSLVQTNHSSSAMGVVRGLHLQVPPSAQGKLVRCTRGRVFDVVVDLRAGVKGAKAFTLELDAQHPRMLWVPPGFAHGFQALTDGAELQYAVSAEYDAGAERSILWNDPALAIPWPMPVPPGGLAPKDAAAPRLADAGLPERLA